MQTSLLVQLLTFLTFIPFVNVNDDPYVVVLGIAQDGGYPHAGCNKECCQELFNDRKKGALVSCLAIVDPQTNQRWILDCTPDFPQQLANLNRLEPHTKGHPLVDGIFLTHAHIGHYSGMIHCAWLGNTPSIAHKHYLTMTDEHFESAVRTGDKLGTQTPALCRKESHAKPQESHKLLETESFSEVVGLLENARVAKEGLGKSLSNTLNYRVGKVRAVNTEPQTEPFRLINRQELDTLLGTDAPECTALVWLQGEVKDALFNQMLKGS